MTPKASKAKADGKVKVKAKAKASAECNLKVRYPTPGTELSVSGTFFAHGVSAGGAAVGLLTNDRTEKVHVGKVLPSEDPKQWLLFFKVPRPRAADTYTLRLYLPPCGGEKPAAVVRRLRFSRPMTFGVDIEYPTNNDQCCPLGFSAGGTLSGNDTDIATATMNAVSFDAKVIQLPSWTCTWHSLPAGTYTLTVTGNGGGAPPPVTGLDLNVAHC